MPKYFPNKVHIEELNSEEFVLMDTQLAEGEDAELCRFTFHGSLTPEMKREFGEQLAKAINRYASVLSRVGSDDD